ncbi:MAG TPA: ABC transporter permease [Acidimicrobiia bacterium]|nr:ABC transporter permease [Acidimicrobiia bacterium]
MASTTVAAPRWASGAGTTGAPVVDAVAERVSGRQRVGVGWWIAVGWLTVVALLALLAPVLPFVKDPSSLDPDALRQGPTLAHWFGGDDGGRDVFARVVWGARVSLFIGVASVSVGLAIGGFVGLTAGYFRGRYERVVMSAMDVMLAFPSLILALALVTFLSTPGEQGGSMFTVTAAVSIIAVPSLARITRAATLTFARREFVTAARALGAKHRRIIVREVLPNVVPPMASFALLAIAVVIVAEGALSYLGLSVQAPQPTWGNLIAQGRPQLDIAPHIALFPCAVMFITLLSLNFVGDKLRARFDVREVRL